MALPDFYLLVRAQAETIRLILSIEIVWCYNRLNFIYKKVEFGSLINKSTIKEELDTDVELDRMDDNSGDENPYKELIVNNADRVEMSQLQMEQWSILSNVINYVKYSKNP